MVRVQHIMCELGAHNKFETPYRQKSGMSVENRIAPQGFLRYRKKKQILTDPNEVYNEIVIQVQTETV